MIGTRSVKKWFEPRPYGMVLIPTGSLNIGQNDEDMAWSMAASQRTITLPAFWMDETEITNDEYRQFVYYVIDSVKRQRLADEGYDEFLVRDRQGNVLEPPRLDWRARIDLRRNEEYKEILDGLNYSGEDRIQDNELDVRRLIYNYSWYDFTQAALNDSYYDPKAGTYTGGTVVNALGEREAVKGRASFIMRREVPIYPDTLCWLKDFTFAFNDPYVYGYFSHVSYDDYPVVGVNWHQAHAFCHWRTQFFLNASENRVQSWRLPSESEWEYAARGGLTGADYPWGSYYTRNKKGCFMANFKPMRGNYIGDGGAITVRVGTYEPNGYGLYDMAGNVAEWTGDTYDESAYQVTHDMSPYYQYISKESDNRIFKRKTVRGGSWKDAAFYLQNGVRSYEFQDSCRSFVGFRTVRTVMQ